MVRHATLSLKVLLNAYTRLLAKASLTLSIHCVHPGLVETKMLQEYIEVVTPKGFQEQTANEFFGKEGIVGVGEGVDTVVWLVVQRPPREKSRLFWYKQAVLSFHYCKMIREMTNPLRILGNHMYK